MLEHVLRLPPPTWLTSRPASDRLFETQFLHDPLRMPVPMGTRESEKVNDWEKLWIDLGGEG